MKFTSHRRGLLRRFDQPVPRPRLLSSLPAGAVIAAMMAAGANAQVGFIPSTLNGLVIGNSNKANKVTSIQFGPDNRLYFTQVNGTIIACDVTRQGPGQYVASDVETISLVKGIPNYDDDGSRNFSQINRQCTGILVVGTAENPVLYVSSCDPREGAGSGGTDLNLDTNSGVISRLSRNPSGVWEKIDIVRGLPRSEENHASNGLNISADGNTLFVAQGGNTNAGAPSNNFAFSCETALAAAILSIDLTAINGMPVKTDAYGQQYVYDIPTLDDPNPARAHNPDGSDVNDPFGGNDGLNQAKIVPGGPVQVYASGFRNPYDVLIAKTPGRVGKMYSFDNAGNSGWGGYPMNEATPANVTNQYVTNEPGTVNNLDGLYLITGPGYYRGHPNPIRANPSGAGWFRNDEGGAGGVFSFSPTSDWPPVPPSMADPQQGNFKLPGEDGVLITNSASTTGMAEYTAGNFGGAMVGDIIVTQYSSATVQRISMNATGTAVVTSSVLLNGSSYGTPLDVTCPGPGAAPELSGTIFVGHHSSKITVLEPTDFDSGGGAVCTGIFSFALDEDNDGYSNADEITNYSDPCSPAVMPPDRDGDFLSDSLDSDDDNDGIPDSQDLFPIDALNGGDIAPYVRRELFNELGTGFFSIGFTGVMLNPGEDYIQKIDADDLIAGGTAGLFTDPGVGPGNPHGNSNTQMNAFHFGVSIDETTGPFVFRSGLGGLLFNGTPQAGQSQGIFIGTGDQDNYLKVAVNANSGAGGIEIVHEEDGVILSQSIAPAPGLFGGLVVLQILVDPIAGTVHPGYSIGGGAVQYVGSPLVVGGKILEAIRGSSATAFGLLATTGDVSTPTFNATWDYFEVAKVPGTAAAKLTIGSSFGSLNSSSTYGTSSFKIDNLSTGGQSITSVIIDTSTAILPDVVFDPLGTAGDLDSKGFTLNSFSGSGTPVGVWESPNNGVDGADGYHVLRVQCGPGVNFGPGALLTFSADIDPTSVKGVAGPGPFHAASVSGLELIGATATVTFSDGSVRKVRNSGVNGIEGEHRTSMGVLSPDNLPTPGLSVPGRTSPFTTATQPTVRVVGPAGASVQVWDFHSALHLDDGGDFVVPNGGYDLDPYETNTVHAYGFTTVTIGANGFVDVPMSLGYTQALGGINQVVALMVDSNGNRSSCSQVLTIEYDPNFTPATAVARVNAGGGAYVDMAGRTWSADTGFTSGSVTGFANPIAGTTDDTLYQTFRFDNSPGSPLDYVFAVQNGNYEVRLHFAETWSGISAAGQRVFDVFLEGQLALDDLDVFATAGPNTAHVETLQTGVADGQLTIGLRHVTENPMISAIEIFSLGASGPDTQPPSAPGVFTFNNLKAGSVTLAWSPATDIVGVTGYRVFRDNVEIAETPLLTLQVAELTPLTEYEFSVEAYDAAGNISPRVQLAVTTPADQDIPSMPGAIRGISGNGIAMLSWTASTDDHRVGGYRIFRDSVELGEVTGLEFSDTNVVNGINYLYEVEAFDASGKTSARAAVSVRPRALGPAVLRVDCGASSPFVDSFGNTWAADFGFNTGQVELNSTIAIAGTTNDAIYQSRRHDRNTAPELKYTFPLADGEYEIHLHFAEIWSGASGGPGIRVFDVKVNNQLALDDFDMFAAAGFATAHVETIPVTVSGGQVSIEFIHVVQNPSISAIEIFPLDESPPDTVPPTAPTGLTVTGTTAGSIALAWTAATDPGGSVSGYRISKDGQPVATVSALNHTVTGLASSTLYELSVVALDAANNSSEPALISASTTEDTTPPAAPGSLSGQPGNGSATLSWAPSLDDSLVSYEVWRDGSLVATVSSLGYTDAGLTNNTAYTYSVHAVDSGGNRSAASVVVVTPRALGPALLRVNVGSSSSYVDPAGNVWSPDFGYNTGYTEPNTNVISGTDIPVIYQSRRIDRSSGDELKYQFTVPNGSYQVRLHFAEVWSGANAPGIRVFDVFLEGALALDSLDLFAEVGSNAAFVATLSTVVTDGNLTIDFLREIQNPNISGIEIFPATGSGAPDNTPDGQAPSSPKHLEAIAGNGSVELTWSAASDNVMVTGYEIRRDGSLIATVPVPGYTDSGLTNGRSYVYSVSAFDAVPNLSAAATDSATPRVLGNVVTRVNAGGPAFRDVSGNDWIDDQGFNLGTTLITASEISGTDNDVLYQSERYDGSAGGSDLEYAFPVPDGLYEVKLHFAETYSLITTAGQRQFDVFAEEQLALDDLDIFARVGSNAALVLAFPVEVSDGQINLRFDHGVQNPKICGIEIAEILPSAPPTFEEWLTGNGLIGQTTGDADGGGLSNLEEFELQMDPNDPNDDLGFRLTCTDQGASRLIALPVLKPIGNYYLHRDTDLDDLGNLANRIHEFTITKEEIELMSPLERSTYTVEDNTGGERAFYQLIFEPVAE